MWLQGWLHLAVILLVAGDHEVDGAQLQGWLHWAVILLVAGDHEVDGVAGLAALGRDSACCRRP